MISLDLNELVRELPGKIMIKADVNSRSNLCVCYFQNWEMVMVHVSID